MGLSANSAGSGAARASSPRNTSSVSASVASAVSAVRAAKNRSTLGQVKPAAPNARMMAASSTSRAGRLRQISPSLIRELCARSGSARKGGDDRPEIAGLQ